MDESSSGTLLYSPANDITPFQASKCIICENSKRCSVTSTTNGRTKIIEAASIKKDIVLERLNGIEENFVYHMDNECYKRYVMKKTIDKLTEAEESHSDASEYNGDVRWNQNQNAQGTIFAKTRTCYYYFQDFY